jgi:hypothetical protein
MDEIKELLIKAATTNGMNDEGIAGIATWCDYTSDAMTLWDGFFSTLRRATVKDMMDADKAKEIRTLAQSYVNQAYRVCQAMKMSETPKGQACRLHAARAIPVRKSDDFVEVCHQWKVKNDRRFAGFRDKATRAFYESRWDARCRNSNAEDNASVARTDKTNAKYLATRDLKREVDAAAAGDTPPQKRQRQNHDGREIARKYTLTRYEAMTDELPAQPTKRTSGTSRRRRPPRLNRLETAAVREATLEKIRPVSGEPHSGGRV